MKKSFLSTTFSLLLFLSSSNSSVLARVDGRTMSTTEIVPFCQEIKNLFDKDYGPVLRIDANPEHANPIPLDPPIDKLVDNMSNMVKNAETTKSIALSSYVLRLLERSKIVSGVVLLGKFDDPKNGHSVVVYKRQVNIKGKRMEKWFVCDLSSAFLFWTRSKIMNSSEAKNRTLCGIGLKDPKDALKSMEDFLSIPLLYYFNDMGASKIYDAPKVLDCDRNEFSIVSLPMFIRTSLLPNKPIKSFPIEIIGTASPVNSVTIATSDYDKKILKFFDDIEFEHEKRVVEAELIKRNVNVKDVIETFWKMFGNK